MARRLVAMLVLAFALAAIAPASAAPAEKSGGPLLRWPGGGKALFPRLLPRRLLPRLPNYYFDSFGAFVFPRRPLASGDVAKSLATRGFHEIGPVRQRGTTYITEATGPDGERVRLVINGVTGGIDGVRVIRRSR